MIYSTCEEPVLLRKCQQKMSNSDGEAGGKFWKTRMSI